MPVHIAIDYPMHNIVDSNLYMHLNRIQFLLSNQMLSMQLVYNHRQFCIDIKIAIEMFESINPNIITKSQYICYCFKSAIV